MTETGQTAWAHTTGAAACAVIPTLGPFHPWGNGLGQAVRWRASQNGHAGLKPVGKPSPPGLESEAASRGTLAANAPRPCMRVPLVLSQSVPVEQEGLGQVTCPLGALSRKNRPGKNTVGHVTASKSRDEHRRDDKPPRLQQKQCVCR